ncbi:ABC transporter C family member 7 [Camellia lanceoleosa]|uniref:ABC transporter C family member 7 n=1 Tax=Camellia lanceoleosa TaxID=1840588 RepID=A0ACC0H1V5_9ERIC|nr:ABC transporter C family member 7 [Camellia lanceoleosa]
MLQKAGIRAKAVLVAKIYNKGLIISCQSKQGHTSGEAINLMTVDAERIGDFGWYIHDPWMAVLNVFLGLAILYKNLGFASFAALVAIGLVMLANLPLGSLQEKFQEKLMEWKDKRMKAASEVLRNMRILKLQAWEMKFLSKIIELRNVEAGWLRKSLYTIAITTFVFWVAPTFVSMVTFGACMLLGIALESGKVLSSLVTFRILRGPIYSLPDTFTFIYQTKVSLDQIASFIRLDDLHPDAIEKLARGSSKTAIEIVDGTFSWDVASPNPTLKDISMSVSHEWYEVVLEACSLKKDLEILPFGDQTVIGERGINLSWGQKQRIQIARALYQDADIYLFDDPFSAVDAHTGSHLYRECLLRLLASKTVIYMTHQVEFLPASDLILVMKDGRIAQAGKYNNILNSGTDFMELVGAHQDILSTLDSIVAKSVLENLAISEEDKETEHGQNGKGDDIVGQRKGQCVQEEEREKGRVGLSVYWKYITTAYGGALVPFILLAQDVAPPVSGSTLITVYVALAIGCSFCILARALLLVAAWYKSATILFNRMHFCIFRAPMSFFDATPSGRILNRASTDQSALDLDVPNQLGNFAFLMIELLGIIAVMSQVAWQVFIVFVPVIATCIWLQVKSNKLISKTSSIGWSVQSSMSDIFFETISGSATIRSFDQESRFIETSVKLIDGHSRPKFYNAAALEWLCLRLYMLSAITFIFSLVFLIFAPPGTIDPSVAGLAVTYGLTLNISQGRFIWNLCRMENSIISVERIFQYTSIPSKLPLVIETNRPNNDWPLHGQVDIRDLQV